MKQKRRYGVPQRLFKNLNQGLIYDNIAAYRYNNILLCCSYCDVLSLSLSLLSFAFFQFALKQKIHRLVSVDFLIIFINIL